MDFRLLIRRGRYAISLGVIALIPAVKEKESFVLCE